MEPLIAHHGVDIVNGVAMPLLLIGLLFVIDWRLGLVALAPLPLALLIQIVMMRGFTERQAHYNDIVARMHEAQLEFLRSIGVMKLYGVDADSFRQLDRAMVVHQSMTADYIRQLIGAWVGFVTVAQASLFFLVPLAIVLVAAGTLSLADGVVAAIVAAGMLKPWLALTQLVGQVSETFVAVARLLSLCPQQEATKGSLDEPLQSLACRNLTLSRGGRTLFRELTLTVIPGQQAVLQGASGGGKSSLLELLSGQLAPDQGDWLLNGHAISTLTDECRARYVASVSQQAFSSVVRLPTISGLLVPISMKVSFGGTEGSPDSGSSENTASSARHRYGGDPPQFQWWRTTTAGHCPGLAGQHPGIDS